MRVPYYVLALATITSTDSTGQQLLSGDLSFVPGETFNFASADAMEAGPGGTGLTWDFGELAPFGEIEYTWLTPSAFESATYPGITVARDVAFSCTEYWQAAPDRFSELGNRCGITLSSEIYDDPRDVVRYPFAFGNTFTDTYGGMYRVGGGQPDSSVINGIITVTADATGTLILPWATHAGIIRLHVEQEEEFVDFNTTFNREEFWYVKPGVHMPLLKLLSTWDNANPEPVDFATVQVPNVNAITDNWIPIPVVLHYENGVMHLRSTDGQLASCEVFTADGRCVGQWALHQGRNDHALPLHAQAGGLLTIRVIDRSGRTRVQRLVVMP
ncbi:MAG: hypothetical protein JNN32_07765 [Flavobacteriales bacterium]|nr:hypothetical protein [Flavobacteriales bacterium]